MAESKTPKEKREESLKARRMASDKRIVASAVKNFGKLGYTYSSIRGMAKDAGITSGLITQRYGTKENLFLEAYKNASEKAFSDVDSSASPRECLYAIISDIQKLCDKNHAAFEFLSMLHSASDYPKDMLKPSIDEMKETNTYAILKSAQEKGMLPKGSFDALMASFSSMVFHNTGTCKKYKQDYPEPEKYLEFIHFHDKLSEQEKEWTRILKTAIANTFDILVFVNIPENRCEVLDHSDTYIVYSDHGDARASIELSLKNNHTPEEQEELREFLNLDTIGERMRGRKSVSHKSRETDGGVTVHSILPITWDEAGNLTEIMMGVYRKKD